MRRGHSSAANILNMRRGRRAADVSNCQARARAAGGPLKEDRGQEEDLPPHIATRRTCTWATATGVARLCAWGGWRLTAVCPSLPTPSPMPTTVHASACYFAAEGPADLYWAGWAGPTPPIITLLACAIYHEDAAYILEVLPSLPPSVQAPRREGGQSSRMLVSLHCLPHYYI